MKRRMIARASSVVGISMAVTVLVAGCIGLPNSRPTATETVTVEAEPATSSASTPSGGAGSLGGSQTPGPIDAGDYETGLLFDYGVITDVIPDGATTSIEFNRQQLYTDDGLQSGTQFTKEPIVYANSDLPFVDENDKVRRYVLAPNAEVLRLADPVPCGGGQEPADPVWESIGVDGLRTGGATNRTQDSLSFDESGRVSRVRLSSSC